MAYIRVSLFNATEKDLWIKQIQILSVKFLLRKWLLANKKQIYETQTLLEKNIVSSKCISENMKWKIQYLSWHFVH